MRKKRPSVEDIRAKARKDHVAEICRFIKHELHNITIADAVWENFKHGGIAPFGVIRGPRF